jgi:hypothetical protein
MKASARATIPFGRSAVIIVDGFFVLSSINLILTHPFIDKFGRSAGHYCSWPFCSFFYNINPSLH